MKYERYFAQATAARLFSAILLVAMAGTAATQEAPKTKKFLTKPLVIEDQGSFFIGGVPKVTLPAEILGCKCRGRHPRTNAAAS